MEHDDIPVDDENDTRACPDCDASGYDDEDGSPCGRCGGLGYIESAAGVGGLGDGAERRVEAAAAGLRWCHHCGEGVTDFCRGKSRLCPNGLLVPHRNAGVPGTPNDQQEPQR